MSVMFMTGCCPLIYSLLRSLLLRSLSRRELSRRRLNVISVGHLIQTKRKAPFSYVLLFKFGCPSYSFNPETCILHYDVLNDDKTSSFNGRQRANFIEDQDVSELKMVVGRPDPIKPTNFDSIKIWLDSSPQQNPMDCRLFFYSITVIPRVSDANPSGLIDGKHMQVYPTRRWVGREAQTIQLLPESSTVERKNKFEVPRITLPELSRLEATFIGLATCCFISMTTFSILCIEKCHTVRGCHPSILLFDIYCGIFAGIIFLIWFTITIRLELKMKEMHARLVNENEVDPRTARLLIVIPISLGFVSLVMCFVVGFIGLRMGFGISILWIILNSFCLLVVLGVWFLIIRYKVWRRITKLIARKMKKVRGLSQQEIAIGFDVFKSDISLQVWNSFFPLDIKSEVVSRVPSQVHLAGQNQKNLVIFKWWELSVSDSVFLWREYIKDLLIEQ